MTDNEIVKAWIVVLENKRMPTEYLINVTIDRINSLTADVFRQQAEIDVKNRLLDEAKAEIERLENHIQEGIDLAKQIPEMMELVKSEAYREFAELLKQHKYQSSDWSHGEHPYVVEESDIDNTLNELVGEDK